MANSATSAALNVTVAGSVLLTGAVRGPLLVLTHVVLWGSLVHLSFIVGIVASRVRILGIGARAVARLPVIGRGLRMDPATVRGMEQAIGSALTERPATLARIVLLEISAQALLVAEVYWATRSMGVAASFRSALMMEVLSRAFTIVEFVGATEMGFAMVFTWLGLPAAIGFTLSLVKTLRSLTAGGIALGALTGTDRSSAALVTGTRPPGAVLDSGT
jgi:hypothetical protein